MTDAIIDSSGEIKTRSRADWIAYVSMMRIDHSTKQIFIIPGIVLAELLRGVHASHPILATLTGFMSAIFIASANYVINEWLDRNFDAFHPEKSKRAAVQCSLSPKIIWIMWGALVVLGLACASVTSSETLCAACLFALQGIVYNVTPLRTKDKPYLDVISESINSPIRLIIGWSIIDPTTFPPSSVILAYWMSGAFLMAAKRYSEFSEISKSHGQVLLARYRASFRHYTEVSLMTSCFVYAMLANFLLAVFLIKYRIEYVLCFPFLVALFAYYMIISLRPRSSAQRPERLFREKGLMIIVLMLAATFLGTTFINIPLLNVLLGQRFIQVQIS